MTKNPFKFKELPKKRKKEGPKLLVQLIRQTSNKLSGPKEQNEVAMVGPLIRYLRTLMGDNPF